MEQRHWSVTLRDSHRTVTFSISIRKTRKLTEMIFHGARTRQESVSCSLFEHLNTCVAATVPVVLGMRLPLGGKKWCERFDRWTLQSGPRTQRYSRSVRTLLRKERKTNNGKSERCSRAKVELLNDETKDISVIHPAHHRVTPAVDGVISLSSFYLDFYERLSGIVF